MSPVTTHALIRRALATAAAYATAPPCWPRNSKHHSSRTRPLSAQWSAEFLQVIKVLRAIKISQLIHNPERRLTHQRALALYKIYCHIANQKKVGPAARHI